MTRLLLSFIVALLAGTTRAGEPVLTVEPRELHGLPGEPLQVELTIETDHVTPIQLRIPAVSNLVLRTVEKIPIRRTDDGCYIQKRIVIWQGIEAGSVTLTNLTVNFQCLEPAAAKVPSIGKAKQAATRLLPGIGKAKQTATQLLPNIGITIDDVTPAEPPAKKETK